MTQGISTRPAPPIARRPAVRRTLRRTVRRTVRLAWRRHRAEEDGAVTASWMAITAAVVAISAAVLSTISTATQHSASSAVVSLNKWAAEGPSF